AVVVGHEIEIAATGGRGLELGPVAGEAQPTDEADVLAGKSAGGQHRLRHGAGLLGVFVAEKYAAEHYRPALDGLGENGVEVELRPDLRQRLRELRNAGEFLFG